MKQIHSSIPLLKSSCTVPSCYFSEKKWIMIIVLRVTETEQMMNLKLMKNAHLFKTIMKSHKKVAISTASIPRISLMVTTRWLSGSLVLQYFKKSTNETPNSNIEAHIWIDLSVRYPLLFFEVHFITRLYHCFSLPIKSPSISDISSWISVSERSLSSSAN